MDSGSDGEQPGDMGWVMMGVLSFVSLSWEDLRSSVVVDW